MSDDESVAAVADVMFMLIEDAERICRRDAIPFGTYKDMAEQPPSPYDDARRIDHVPSGWRACIIKYAVRATCSTMEEADERLATANLL